MNVLFPEILHAKPFLKWAGGKSQLINSIEDALPKDIKSKKSLTFVEPFIGSGAVLFWFLQKYPNIERAIINDINTDLTKAYTVIKEQPYDLISAMNSIQAKYYSLTTEADRRVFFMDKRQEFNSRHLDPVSSTSLLIFINRTCFNGLYRVNSKNQFNVPFGKYERPKISDPETIIADSNILKKVIILNGDYEDTLKHAEGECFFYFDPPYKPISKTASFNSYAKDTFDDSEQIRLKIFCDLLTSKKHKWLLSNSDPKNTNPDDNFFDELYCSPETKISRVKAKRSINSNSSKRGEINELLICNYIV
jgi:DNA adenine methylase